MTDKQTIIGGIDVSECEYCGYENVCKLKSASNYIVDCKDTPNCYYKQLKRKEQECEELKKQLESTKGLVMLRRKCLEAVKVLADNANLPNISLYIDSFLNEEPQKINEVEDEKNM